MVHLAAAVGVGQSMYEIARYTSVNALGAAILLEAAIAVRAGSRRSSSRPRCRSTARASTAARRKASLQTPRASSRRAACREGVGARSVPSAATAARGGGDAGDKPLQPASIYAIGKRDHEEMFLAWGRAYKVPATALRFFNVYGPRQALSNPYTGVAAIFSSRLLNGRPPVVFEDGHQSRDFVHVTDIAAGVEAALEPGKGDFRAINLGTGVSTSVLRRR